MGPFTALIIATLLKENWVSRSVQCFQNVSLADADAKSCWVYIPAACFHAAGLLQAIVAIGYACFRPQWMKCSPLWWLYSEEQRQTFGTPTDHIHFLDIFDPTSHVYAFQVDEFHEPSPEELIAIPFILLASMCWVIVAFIPWVFVHYLPFLFFSAVDAIRWRFDDWFLLAVECLERHLLIDVEHHYID